MTRKNKGLYTECPRTFPSPQDRSSLIIDHPRQEPGTRVTSHEGRQIGATNENRKG